MVGRDRIHTTALRLGHRGDAQPLSKLWISDQLENRVGKSPSHAFPLAGEDHSGITVPDVSRELREIAHHGNSPACHGLERSHR